MKTYKSLAMVLVIIGAMNWGLVGLLGLNLVNSLLGSVSILEKVVYLAVGASGAFLAYLEWGGTTKKK